MHQRIIGIDFDNTIIRYDELAYQTARELCALPPDLAHDKTAVRDFLRASAGGDLLWQRVQGQIYGNRILGAQMAEGFAEFVETARSRGARLCVVSHKTTHGHFDASGVNLRAAALEWMAAHDFFSAKGLGFSREEIFFGAERAEKLAHIRALGCAAFIDDLIEVFLEPEFPPGCKKLLYCAAPPEALPTGVEAYASWRELASEVARLLRLR